MISVGVDTVSRLSRSSVRRSGSGDSAGGWRRGGILIDQKGGGKGSDQVL
jgi:hypothetical protein